ncbi:hypothetical protein CVT26_009865 [Gymnopilus dilepis]|uniref:Uncharacterized protein n=1 Tax=Gymnopilus dilepis TaxID=231916 RepID=A0A409YC74_9AGAR|nr:hypothetical protein CVT26_009865 [Gymnopilus dilepis]
MDYSTSGSSSSNGLQHHYSLPLGTSFSNPPYAPTPAIDFLQNVTVHSTAQDVDFVTGPNELSFPTGTVDSIPDCRRSSTYRRRGKLEGAHGKRRRPTSTKGLGTTQPRSLKPYARGIRYMEALEQYIAFLYQQFKRLGVQPPLLVLSEGEKPMSESALKSLALFLRAAFRNETRLLELERDISGY